MENKKGSVVGFRSTNEVRELLEKVKSSGLDHTEFMLETFKRYGEKTRKEILKEKIEMMRESLAA